MVIATKIKPCENLTLEISKFPIYGITIKNVYTNRLIFQHSIVNGNKNFVNSLTSWYIHSLLILLIYFRDVKIFSKFLHKKVPILLIPARLQGEESGRERDGIVHSVPFRSGV